MKFRSEEEAFEYYEAKFEEERLERVRRAALRKEVEARHALTDSEAAVVVTKTYAPIDLEALKKKPLRAVWYTREDEARDEAERERREQEEDARSGRSFISMINALIADDDQYEAWVEATELRESLIADNQFMTR